MALTLPSLVLLIALLTLSIKLTFRAGCTLRLMRATRDIKSRDTGRSVSIIVPARDEALNIGDCLESLQQLIYDTDKLEIIVVDDASTDETASIVTRFERRDKPCRLIHATPLPDGWTGKNHACFVGAKEAKHEILLFIDADVRLLPNALAATVSHMTERGAKMLSLWPSQRIESVGERLLLPGLFLSLSETINFYDVESSSAKKAMANGQFMMFEKRSYFDLGGHERVRDILGEDVAFAKLYKSLRIATAVLLDGGTLATVRMYRSFSDSWKGFSKNLSEIAEANYPVSLLYQVLRSLTFGLGAWWLLYLCVSQPDYAVWAFGAALWGVLAGATAALRVPLLYTLTVPLGFIGYSYLVAENYVARRIKPTFRTSQV